jgi:TPR repeat protein
MFVLTRPEILKRSLMSYQSTLQTVISTNKLSWKQNQILDWNRLNNRGWVNNQLIDVDGWIRLEIGRGNGKLNSLETSEKCGNIVAKTYIGEYYANKCEYELALKYWMEALELGENIFAPYYLARYYRFRGNYGNPEGCVGTISEDNRIALEYYKISAENGNAHGMHMLYVILKDESPRIAIGWLIKSAELYLNAKETIKCNPYILDYYNELVKNEELSRQNKLFKRLQELDIGSLVYYDIKRYM